MQKLIGLHRKGNANDKFGFVSNETETNLFIHDNEFSEDINRFQGKEVYVCFRKRASKIKKGYNEGYDGCSLESETDVDFLIDTIVDLVKGINGKSIYNVLASVKLSEQIVLRLAAIGVDSANLRMFLVYFDENSLEDILKNSTGKVIKGNPQNAVYTIMLLGLKTFFLDRFEEIQIQIKEFKETEVLREMGFESVNKFEALTESFFNDFTLFKKLFSKFSEDVNKEFIYKVILESEELPFEDSFESIKKFIQLVKDNNSIINKENAFTLFSNLSTPKIRLYLWLNDLTDVFNFQEYKDNVWKLERKDQARFIKKIFYLKSKEKIELTLNDLNEIKVFNIDSFREIKQNNPNVSFSNLDFNVSLVIYILNIISEVKQFDKNFSGKFFEYFLEYVSDYSDIQHVDFFYPLCIGRTNGKKEVVRSLKDSDSDDGLEEETFKYSYYHNKNDKPLYHNFCDGQLDRSNSLNFPNEKPYSWCAGLPCFNASNSQVDSQEDYYEWTIIDFLKLLAIDYDASNISFLLGYINKANLLIDRLKCNGCNKLLKPSGQNKFTYHIVNKFHCSTEVCAEFNKEVYLNHCLNKHCSNIIDSRVSKKCRHEGYDPSCGWYICDSCYSCCGTNVISRVIDRKQMLGQEYSCSTVGHDELKKTFCYNCGDKMILNKEYYIRQQGIIVGLNNTRQIKFVESKENKNGHWRYRLNFNAINIDQREVGIQKLKSSGFKLTEGRTHNVYFVDHLITIALECRNTTCPNQEVISPHLSGKWKVFNDKHGYYADSVRKFFKQGNIKHIEFDDENTEPGF